MFNGTIVNFYKYIKILLYEIYFQVKDQEML
jgi:hypothetical protein